jgi:hypothetical protein
MSKIFFVEIKFDVERKNFENFINYFHPMGQLLSDNNWLDMIKFDLFLTTEHRIKYFPVNIIEKSLLLSNFFINFPEVK